MERQYDPSADDGSVFCELMKHIDSADPHYRERYDHDSAIQKSFTPEQLDYLCAVIGDWYLHWKGQLVSKDEPGAHRLGVAKEHLKRIICGDNLHE